MKQGLLRKCLAAALVVCISTFALFVMASTNESHSGEESRGDEHGESGGHGEHEEETGPNGGRLLEDGDRTVELMIFESGMEPQFRAWITDKGKPVIEPGEAILTVELTRLGGEIDRFKFSPNGDYWLSEATVKEPHSFDVKVSLFRRGERVEWKYDSHEGRIEIVPAMAEKAGVKVAKARSGKIRQTITVYGKAMADPTKVSRIRARFPGPVTGDSVNIGDRVKAGQPIAEIESNESLQRYPLKAPFDSVVISKNVSIGDYADNQVLFTLANYDRLWADLQVFPGRSNLLAPGQKVRLEADGRLTESAIESLVPGESGQPFVTARVPIDNRNGRWSPGLLVEGKVTVDEVDVPLMVDNRGLQPFRDWTVVFVNVGDAYEIRPLELGRSDGRFTEVLGGLKAGDRYVVENSYLIKADIEKAGASHEH